MKSRKVFILMVLMQLGVFIFMTANRERVTRYGNEHRFKIVLRDPYDFMRGEYLMLNLEQQDITGISPEIKQKKGYLLIDKKDGYSRITGFSQEKPSQGDYVKGEILYNYNGKAVFKNPFKRFYMEEGMAGETEKKMVESNNAYIAVKIYRGNYVIESIEIR